MTALYGAATARADGWRELDDFSNYPLGEIILGKGDRGAWRAKGLNRANAGEIVASGEEHVLGLRTRSFAIFDAPHLFSLSEAEGGRVSFRVKMPAVEAKQDDAFFFILKTREQTNEGLTRPDNGLILLQISYDAPQKAYRLRLEGPGPSPTQVLVTPGAWYVVDVKMNMAKARYEVWLTPPGGTSTLVTNHLYRDGAVPFKNRGAGAAEMIYLRNQSLPGRVEIAGLRFLRGTEAEAAR